MRRRTHRNGETNLGFDLVQKPGIKEVTLFHSYVSNRTFVAVVVNDAYDRRDIARQVEDVTMDRHVLLDRKPSQDAIDAAAVALHLGGDFDDVEDIITEDQC